MSILMKNDEEEEGVEKRMGQYVGRTVGPFCAF